MACKDQSRYLRLAATLSEFREKLRARAQTLEVWERQKILRLVVHDIFFGMETIRIRHSLPVVEPVPGRNGGAHSPPFSGPNRMPGSQSYLLRSGSHDPVRRD